MLSYENINLRFGEFSSSQIRLRKNCSSQNYFHDKMFLSVYTSYILRNLVNLGGAIHETA